MLLFVCAAGAGGMMLARQFVRVPAPAQTDVASRDGAQGGAAPASVAAPALNAAVPAGGATATPATRPAVTRQTGATPVDAEKPGWITENEQIQLVLRRWQTALLSNDAAQVAPSYSASVERYFLQTGVSRNYVREYMRAEEARGLQLMSYDLRDVQIEHVSAGEVDVRFVAKFTVRTPNEERSGSARTLLKLRPEDGDWKIFYERDYRS